jgi:hypothetical protein
MSIGIRMALLVVFGAACMCGALGLWYLFRLFVEMQGYEIDQGVYMVVQIGLLLVIFAHFNKRIRDPILSGSVAPESGRNMPRPE